MPRQHKIPLDPKNLSLFLQTTISNFLQSLLLHPARRRRHKESCSDRLAASSSSAGAVKYSDQAVLANLDWGIDALEDALSTSNHEARLALLGHADRMLQVPAMLDPLAATAGVPNSYLSAWSHLHLACLSTLRSGDGALHVLEMFDVEPRFARTDFAPEVWEAAFAPHMDSIVGWYLEARGRAGEGEEELRELDAEYGASLDRCTRVYARYYKEVVGGESMGVPKLAPIAEPPMTPQHEVRCEVPDFVMFGPILPRSAGFGFGEKIDR